MAAKKTKKKGATKKRTGPSKQQRTLANLDAQERALAELEPGVVWAHTDGRTRAWLGKRGDDAFITALVGIWLSNGTPVRGVLRSPARRTEKPLRVRLGGAEYQQLVTRAQVARVDVRDLLTHILVDAAGQDAERPGDIVEPAPTRRRGRPKLNAEPPKPKAFSIPELALRVAFTLPKLSRRGRRKR